MIDMSKITDYISIEKQYYLDASKYIERANKYLEENKYGHAAGCLAKAAKKLTNAQHLGYLRSDKWLDKALRKIIDIYSDKIAKNILGT